MNPHDELENLKDLARLRPLTAGEQDRLNRFLEAIPQARTDWEEDMALSRLLKRLPDAPLASNFSARVMRAIDAETRPIHRLESGGAGWFRGWVPRFAAGAFVLLIGLGGWHQYQQLQREKYAESVAAISEVAAILSVDVLKDSDAIQSFAAAPLPAEFKADDVLLEALR